MCVCIDPDMVDMVTLLTDKTVQARKKHRCCECGAEILPGKKYHYEAGVNGDGFQAFKTCLGCKEIRDRLMSCGWIWGELWEHVMEFADGLGAGDLDGLSIAAVAKFDEMCPVVCDFCNEKFDDTGLFITDDDGTSYGPLCDECYQKDLEENEWLKNQN
jgi:hypothetical protein